MTASCLNREERRYRLLLVLMCLSLFGLLPVARAPAEERLEDGTALFEQEKWPEARQFFSSFLMRRPTNAQAHFYLGRIAFGEEDYDTAVEWFEKAAELEKRNSNFHLWLGRAYGYQAQQAFVWQQLFLTRKVRQQFEKAVALDADNVAARWDLMEYYLKAPSFLGGSGEKAKTQAREIEQRDADEGKEAWRLIAEIEAES